MRNIKYNNSSKNKILSKNKKIPSLTSVDLRDIYTYNNIPNKENIGNNNTIPTQETNNIFLNNNFLIENKKHMNANKNKLKIEVLKNHTNFKIKKIKSKQNFKGSKINKPNNILFNKSITTYIGNKANKKMNLNNFNDSRKTNLNKLNFDNFFAQTTYNIYSVNTPIYNLINFPTIINNRKYLSPRNINNSSYCPNKNTIKNINSKSLLRYSNYENEKNETISDYSPFSSLRNCRLNKNKNKKHIYINICNDKEKFLNSPFIHNKINELNKEKNIKNKSKNKLYNKKNYNTKIIKPKLIGLKRFLNFSLNKNSKSNNPNVNKKIHVKEKSKSFLSQLNSSININKNMRHSTIQKPKLITKKVMKINSCTLAGYSSPGVQKLNQDKFFIKKDFLDEPEQFFIGVCDGHGMHGHYISEYVSKFLPKNLTNISTDESIKSAFITTQTSLLNDNLKIDSSLSGSTCTSLILSLEKLICINLGDSRAVLARYENGVYNTINLSRDHKLTEPDEMKRVLKSGGIIKQYYDDKTKGYIGPERVFLNNSEIPGLAMSRSIGDSIAHNIGVISEPEIFRFNYNGNEKFIVIATDGIWEYIDSEECVKIISTFYENNMDAVGGLNTLVKEAFKRWKNEEENIDDITAIVIFFE